MARTRGGPKRLKLFLDKRAKDFEAHYAAIHRKVHFQLVDGLVSDTPVGNPKLWKSPPPPGYSGGRARGNWQSSIVGPRAGETGRIDASGSTTKRVNLAVINRLRTFTRSFITNNVPYIVRLNRSPQWSKQQTPGWFERNVQRIRAQFK